MKKEVVVACGLAVALMGVLSAGVSQAADLKVATARRMNLSTLRDSGTYQRFIVRYRDGAAGAVNRAAVLQDVNAALSRAGLVRAGATSRSAGPVSATYLRKLATGAQLVRTRKLTKSEAVALMQQIATNPAVAHVEPDVMMHPIADFRASTTTPATFTPDDTYFSRYQWHLRAGAGATETIGADTTAYANRGGADVANAWDLADGQGVTVAVLDTGLTHHPDLDTSLGDAGYDFISDAFVSGRDTNDRVPGGWDLGDWTTEDPWLSECTDASNPPEPSSWHGTHVAGTIAELTNNGNGMAGSAFGAKVLPVRVLGHCGGYTSDIADAIEWASGGHVDGVPDNATPVQVISMSLGGSGVCTASDVTGTAIADAIGRGTTVVVAAGNSGADAGNYSPASCPGVITVASVGITGKRAFYSNYGNAVTLAAPGGGIYANDGSSGAVVDAGFVWSALNGSETSPDEGNYIYGGMAGTSQATPHVSGSIALLIDAVKEAGLPALTPAQIKTLLTSTARPFPATQDHVIGTGIVDAYAAINKAIATDDGGGDDSAIALTNGQVVAGLGGAAGEEKLYKLDVPAGALGLTLRTFGGTGDVSMYVKIGGEPTATDSNYKSVHTGNSESVAVARPVAGTYYIKVVGAATFGGVSLQGHFIPPAQ